MFVQKINLSEALEKEASGEITIVSTRQDSDLVSYEKKEWRSNFINLRLKAPHVDITKLFSYYPSLFLIEVLRENSENPNVIQWDYFRGIVNSNNNSSDNVEYIYILTNKDYPDLVKIGMTVKTPEKRLVSINSTGVVSHWKLAFSLPITPGNSYAVEQQIHKYFASSRYHAENIDDKEMFFLELPQAIEQVRRIAQYFTAGDPNFYT